SDVCSSDLISPSSAIFNSRFGKTLPTVPTLARSIGLHEIIGEVSVKPRSEEHTSELQSRFDLVCRLLLEKKKHEDKYSILESTVDDNHIIQDTKAIV